MLEDRSLIKQLNQGCKPALRRIYEKYREDLFTMAVSLLGDKHLAEDCLQDVFVRLAEAAGRIQVRSNLKAYLVTSIVNRARDRFRRKSRQINCPVEDLHLPDSAPGPGEQLIEGEQASTVLRAIGQLPVEQSEVFVQHAQAQMSFRQIAKHQGISVRTAHSRYRYAIEKLRVLLNREAGS